MRRLLAIGSIALLAVPATAAAFRLAPGDGTLSVRAGDGTVNLNLRGAVIGKIARGRLEIIDPRDGDCSSPLVWEADSEFIEERPGRLGETRIVCVYLGRNIRFRLVGGQNQLQIRGTGIAVSAVGKGTGFIRGNGGLTDGTFALNGEEYVSLPDEWTRLRLGTVAPPTISG